MMKERSHTMEWNASSLLETVARNEEKVAELYRSLAEETNYGDIFFNNMAADEDRHAEMYRKLIKDQAKDLVVELEEEDKDYLQLMMDTDLFNDADALLEKAGKMRDRSQVLDLCEKIERDAVMYVSEIIRVLPNIASKEMKTVLKEEKKHLQLILRKKSERSLFGIGM